MTPPALVIDPNTPAIPEACWSVPIDRSEIAKDPCSLQILLKEEKETADSSRILRFDRRDGDFFVSPENKPEDLAWYANHQSKPDIQSFLNSRSSKKHTPPSDVAYVQQSQSPLEAQSKYGVLFNLEALGGVNLEQTRQSPSAQFISGIDLGLRLENHAYIGPVTFGLGLQFFGDLAGRYYLNGLPWISAHDGNGSFGLEASLAPILGAKLTKENVGEFVFMTGGAAQLNLLYGDFHSPRHIGTPMFSVGGNLNVTPVENAKIGGTIYIGINPFSIIDVLLSSTGFYSQG